ncbi:uncharacterized protein [Spinacia oleracea]|uniref:DUF4283 domain-containing protein n=1 Tax=Spinacia oleracea TaxID=3562 RepID=A0ABM3RQS1_SPIOL|nr:uncharacterized protein LOC130471719 [Spinacia oleracea]
MIVKPWSATFNFHAEILRVVPLWIKLPNLPLNCWGTDSLSRIGSLVGVPLYADECTSKQLRISFARILVEVDVTKALPRSVLVQDPSGNTVVQKVIYDWIPPYCKKCKNVGNDCSKGMPTARFHPSVHIPKKKWVMKGTVKKNTTTNEVQPKAQQETSVIPNPPVEDDGWRVVTRRRLTKSPMGTPLVSIPEGLVQVNASFDADGVRGGGEAGGGDSPYPVP